MTAFLHMLDERYGGVEGYLKNIVGLTDEDIAIINPPPVPLFPALQEYWGPLGLVAAVCAGGSDSLTRMEIVSAYPVGDYIRAFDLLRPRLQAVEYLKIVLQFGEVETTMAEFSAILEMFPGLKTLHLRMKAHCENALALAEWLEGHPAIEKVIYPGLVSHPQHGLAARQMHGPAAWSVCW